MNIFGVPEAEYYCKRFRKSPGDAGGSLRRYVTDVLKGVGSVTEGTAEFDRYRDCVLREVERLVFLGVSNYRRALDLMMPAASSWAHVTLYYSSYFSGRALLALFGGWIGSKSVVEVAASEPGRQALTKKKIETTYSGSHDRFWDLFYRAVASLVPWVVDPKMRFAITPVSGMVTWQAQNRNDVNYDSFSACRLAEDFRASFDPHGFPGSLPGTLRTQFAVAEGLLLVTTRFVREFGLMTDALNGLGRGRSRRAKMERFIFRDQAPRLIRRTSWRSILM